MSRNIHTGINPHRRPRNKDNSKERVAPVSYTHLTLPTNREV